MAELQALELRAYALTQGTVLNQDDYVFESGSVYPRESRECAVGDLTVQYYRLGELGGLNTEEVVTVLQGNEPIYEAVYDSFSESGQPQDYEVGLSDLSTAQLELLQQAIALSSVAEAELVEPEVQIKGYATVQESYLNRYGEQASTVATVVALAQRGESFDQVIYHSETEEAFFYHVPNSTLIVNRVETTDRDGTTATYTVLDEDEPLFELDGAGRITLKDLTLLQVETLQTAQREGANPLLVNELYFQADLAQGLTKDGQAQARAILSQGDAITPDMVKSLNDLMATEEDIRREDQAERGLAGEVRYPRLTEQDLNRHLSRDMIARRLSAQSPVVEAQVVAESQSQQHGRTPVLSIDERRSRVEAAKPPVAGYESDSTHTIQTQGSVMATRKSKSQVVEAPVVEAAAPEAAPAPVVEEPAPAAPDTMEAMAAPAATEVDLRDLMSKRPLGIVETGKVPQRRLEVEGQKPQLVDRTPEEGFAMVARSAYGAENFCKENGLPHQPSADLIVTAAERLGLDAKQVTTLLDTIEPEKCRPSMEVATGSQEGVWARIEAKYPEYADKVPEAIKAERSHSKAAVDAVKQAVTKATTRQVPAPTLKPTEAAQQLPSQFEMAVTVAAYNLQKEGVDRMGHDNDKAKVIFNKSKDGNISVINKADDTLIASRNAVTGQVVPGTLSDGQDYTKAYAAVVQMQTQKYAPKVATPKAKAGDGR